MNLRPFIKSSSFLTIFFVISWFMLLFISGISYKHARSLTATSELMEESFFPLAIFLITIFSLLVFLLSFIKLKKDVLSLKRSNEDFLITNESAQKLNKIELEERNRELEQSLNELESFNRVASHDLQEPLRKIQTFISRVSVKDKENLSDTGREYLSKIESSANRMRSLIDDLLLFSSTNKSEKITGTSDLNQLLTNALQDLAQVIEEKNAVIQLTKLPLLKVISFQIQQLFVNLIGNALKYSKPGISPVVKIDCEKLAIDDYPDFIKFTHINYYKISISDNGIGFDQQFSEKIFILFNRLHQKAEYPGSGIGLSICKKIVENHDGFIIAEGQPGVGATFIVFLPDTNDD